VESKPYLKIVLFYLYLPLCACFFHVKKLVNLIYSQPTTFILKNRIWFALKLVMELDTTD